MGYYEPKYFGIKELVSKAFYENQRDKVSSVSSIIRVFDQRILVTADAIRVHFCGKRKRDAKDNMYINTWAWGGKYHARGFRHPIIDIQNTDIEDNKKLSITSQHCFGRAIDYTFRRTSVEEVLEDIQRHPEAGRYKFITGIETGVAWCHNDVRCWISSSGLLIFKR